MFGIYYNMGIFDFRVCYGIKIVGYYRVGCMFKFVVLVVFKVILFDLFFCFMIYLMFC